MPAPEPSDLCEWCGGPPQTCLCLLHLFDYVPSRRFTYRWWAALGSAPGPGLWAQVDAVKPRPRLLGWALERLDELEPSPERQAGALDDENLPPGLAGLLEYLCRQTGGGDRLDRWEELTRRWGHHPSKAAPHSTVPFESTPEEPDLDRPGG
jgi:hypothetical protein